MLQNSLAKFLVAMGLTQVARRIDPQITTDRSDEEDARHFVLQIVQPGLAGLMDGSVSTLAPIFATAFATHHAFFAFLVGMASATGAGISMAFAEALSDDGTLTGRGNPVLRGGVTGLMTFSGGVFHSLPFLIANLRLALIVAYVVVVVELVAISQFAIAFLARAGVSDLSSRRQRRAGFRRCVSVWKCLGAPRRLSGWWCGLLDHQP